MVNIANINDIEELRSVAHLLDKENERLIDRIKELTEELTQLKGQDASSAQREIENLLEQLQRNRKVIFGDSSERRAAQRKQQRKGSKKPQTGHGPRPQPGLPLEERVLDLDKDDRTCNVCGGQLDEMKGQSEDSEEITVIERKFTLIKYRRKKYRCRCNACVVTAPGPVKLRPGSRFSPEFAIEVATSKYLDHLPLERQCRIMKREGLNIDSQTLWDQINRLGHLLKPSYEALSGSVNSSPIVFADETWWRQMGEKTPGKRKWWIWSKSNQFAVYYLIRRDRSKQGAKDLLAGYTGIVMADGYSAYGSAKGKSPPPYLLVNCWSHARRKYVDIENNFPECEEVLDLIGKLYEVESKAPPWNQLQSKADQEAALSARARLRDQESRGLIKKIRDWAIEKKPLPESGLGKAIAYMFKFWPGLTEFLEDPRIPLDNNAAERSVRGAVLGRKNHYGSRSVRGTEVAAIFYSLLESAKLCGVEPKAYLRRAVYAAINDPGTVTLPVDLLK